MRWGAVTTLNYWGIPLAYGGQRPESSNASSSPRQQRPAPCPMSQKNVLPDDTQHE